MKRRFIKITALLLILAACLSATACAKKLAIDGEDKITISGGGVSRVFSMTNAYAVLSLHRLVITGGNGVGETDSQLYGGAVYMNATGIVFTARNVTFVNNTIIFINETCQMSFTGRCPTTPITPFFRSDTRAGTLSTILVSSMIWFVSSLTSSSSI